MIKIFLIMTTMLRGTLFVNMRNTCLKIVLMPQIEANNVLMLLTVKKITESIMSGSIPENELLFYSYF